MEMNSKLLKVYKQHGIMTCLHRSQASSPVRTSTSLGKEHCKDSVIAVKADTSRSSVRSLSTSTFSGTCKGTEPGIYFTKKPLKATQ